jgi:hypothetical protein
LNPIPKDPKAPKTVNCQAFWAIAKKKNVMLSASNDHFASPRSNEGEWITFVIVCNGEPGMELGSGSLPEE